MKQIFADTGYWIGLVNPRDQIHQKVMKITRELSSVRLLTTEMVLVELLNSFSDAGPLRRVVGGMVQKLRSNRDVIIVPQTSEQFESALRRYKQAADKSWSLTDCASFEVMEAEQIQAALTHDQHFAQAGFETLLR
jgi:predicted nucleic acid-binding protein